MKAIEYLDRSRKGSFEIAIDTVVMAPNLDELLGMANWVREDNRVSSIFFQSVVQPFHSIPEDGWYKSKEYEFLWPNDNKKLAVVMDQLIELKKLTPVDKRDKINNPISQLELFKSYFKKPHDFVKRNSCNVLNNNTFTVSPDGNLNLCPYMKPIGNIRDSKMQDIWCSNKAYDRRKEIEQCRKNCHHIINCWYEED